MGGGGEGGGGVGGERELEKPCKAVFHVRGGVVAGSATKCDF